MGGEIYLLENRAAADMHLGLQSLVNSGDYSGGLLILHIDDSKTSNSDETHKLVDVEEANNPGLDSKQDNGRYDNLFIWEIKTTLRPQLTQIQTPI